MSSRRIDYSFIVLFIVKIAFFSSGKGGVLCGGPGMEKTKHFGIEIGVRPDLWKKQWFLWVESQIDEKNNGFSLV